MGILTGLAFEADLVLKVSKHMDEGAPVVRCIGMGGAGAVAAARELAGRGVTGVVSFGLAGGLDPALEAGMLVVPEEVRGAAGQTWPVDGAWRAQVLDRLGSAAEASGGSLMACARPLISVRDKQAARQSSGAVAADMESAAIATAAEETGMKLLVVRAIADDAVTALPPAARAMGPSGQLLPGKLLVSLARRPWQLPALIGLGLKTRRACSALEGTVGALVGPTPP